MLPLAIPALIISLAECAATKPNILHILLDDFGWADAAWHRPDGYKDIQSRHMVELVREGVELDRHYVYKFCAPTRAAIQSGRNPIHVNTLNSGPYNHNPADAVSGYSGMPRNMTGMAEHLLRAGYETHMYGKWDVGMATPEHTPRGRGYQTSLHYFHHENDYWNSTAGTTCHHNGREVDVVDLWATDRPARGQNNTPGCSQESQDGCVYEDQLFADAVESAVRGRDRSKPLFVFWAPHIVHMPHQVPAQYLARFSFIKEEHRQYYHAMVYFVDEAIGNVTALLKSEGIWDNTLVVVHADNGGCIRNYGEAGANNFPLKGGKHSNWEGGIRVNAFASGGLLPGGVRGTRQEGLMAGWDWYATYAALAGVDPTDRRAEAAGLPPVDSFNLWPLISGENATSPRAELAIGSEHEVGGLIRGGYKVVLGANSQAGWMGPVFPNTTSHWDPDESLETCGSSPETGCLFDLGADPGEHHNLAAERPQLFRGMVARAGEINRTFFAPRRGKESPMACKMAMERYGGFWGPFVGVDGQEGVFVV